MPGSIRERLENSWRKYELSSKPEDWTNPMSRENRLRALWRVHGFGELKPDMPGYLLRKYQNKEENKKKKKKKEEIKKKKKEEEERKGKHKYLYSDDDDDNDADKRNNKIIKLDNEKNKLKKVAAED